jgi:hypothetical protein
VHIPRKFAGLLTVTRGDIGHYAKVYFDVRLSRDQAHAVHVIRRGVSKILNLVGYAVDTHEDGDALGAFLQQVMHVLDVVEAELSPTN